MLKGGVEGRATFLVHADGSYVEGMASRATQNLQGVPAVAGLHPRAERVRTIAGGGAAKLREGFLAPDSTTARTLALENPESFFLSPTGETFHNLTVTGGKARSEGPLALKQELRDIAAKLQGVQKELGQTELTVAELTKRIADMQHALEGRQNERREAEREAANSGAALRQMESEAARIERRLADWQMHSERNRDARAQRQDTRERKGEEAARLSAEREGVDARVNEAVLANG